MDRPRRSVESVPRENEGVEREDDRDRDPDPVTEAGIESFPASDPPAHSPARERERKGPRGIERDKRK
ncbi:MAG: hypothetical protein H0W33_10950 [Gammaproteobacteria bacterium]|nr:hypothetical protein [Gammaproteobacteria bacterium]